MPTTKTPAHSTYPVTLYRDDLHKLARYAPTALWQLQIKSAPLESYGPRVGWGPYTTSEAAAAWRRADALFMCVRLVRL